MYEAGASDETLGAFGLKASDLQEAVVDVLPDVWPAFQLFRAMSTQWRMGMAGATGLDYAAIPVTGKLLGMNSKAIRSVFDDVRCMEGEALRCMAARDERA